MLLDMVLPLGCLGVAVGFLAAVLGVGGGCIMIPVMGMIFLSQGIDPDIAQRMSLGTALSCTILATFSSVVGHMRHGSMRWDRWKRMCPCVILGSFCGSHMAALIPALTLKICYACFICAMARPVFKLPRARPLPHAEVMLPFMGFLIGVVSGLVGIAGSLVCTVFLACTGLTWMEAVCTGSALGLPICASGVAGFITSGLHVTGLPQYSMGYVSLPALACVAVPAFIAANVTTRICYNRTFPVDFLRKCFAIGSSMLAVGNVFVK